MSIALLVTDHSFEGTAFEGEAFDGTAARALTPRFHADDFFDQQPTPSASLPDPRPLLENLTRCVIEILAGARELDQIARWLSDDVYRHLLKRVVISSRARQAKGAAVLRPTFAIGSIIVCEPRDSVVEASVVVRGRARVRVVAFRLEGLDRRWRATAVHVL
ncbi:MAG: Rv3235 family protein [Pseudolysinimonas sp.]|uniref:Rv3235 family protein n=1 Tax=Pseudolysinimonas sp. TaxID=2680009 RepID=UPI00326736EA